MGSLSIRHFHFLPCLHPFIRLFNKYSVSAKNAPGTVQGTRRQNTEQIAHQIHSEGLLSFIALCQGNCQNPTVYWASNYVSAKFFWVGSQMGLDFSADSCLWHHKLIPWCPEQFQDEGLHTVHLSWQPLGLPLESIPSLRHKASAKDISWASLVFTTALPSHFSLPRTEGDLGLVPIHPLSSCVCVCVCVCAHAHACAQSCPFLSDHEP